MAKKSKFKINGDTMTTIVVSSIIFCIIVVVAGIVLACFGIDISSIVSSALLLFGTELGVCGVMKIFDRNNEQRDREREESRQRAIMRAEERRARNGYRQSEEYQDDQG